METEGGHSGATEDRYPSRPWGWLPRTDVTSGERALCPAYAQTRRGFSWRAADRGRVCDAEPALRDLEQADDGGERDLPPVHVASPQRGVGVDVPRRAPRSLGGEGRRRAGERPPHSTRRGGCRTDEFARAPSWEPPRLRIGSARTNERV